MSGNKNKLLQTKIKEDTPECSRLENMDMSVKLIDWKSKSDFDSNKTQVQAKEMMGTTAQCQALLLLGVNIKFQIEPLLWAYIKADFRLKTVVHERRNF